MTASDDVKHVAVTREVGEGEQCRLPDFARLTPRVAEPTLGWFPSRHRTNVLTAVRSNAPCMRLGFCRSFENACWQRIGCTSRGGWFGSMSFWVACYGCSVRPMQARRGCTDSARLQPATAGGFRGDDFAGQRGAASQGHRFHPAIAVRRQARHAAHRCVHSCKPPRTLVPTFCSPIWFTLARRSTLATTTTWRT